MIRMLPGRSRLAAILPGHVLLGRSLLKTADVS